VNPGDLLKTTRPIRSARTGNILPREATFVRAVENLGRQLILVNFGLAGEEYLFPHEIVPSTHCFAVGLTEVDGCPLVQAQAKKSNESVPKAIADSSS
jgi:hypothetical protein